MSYKIAAVIDGGVLSVTPSFFGIAGIVGWWYRSEKDDV
jgi:hypothetical protein